MKTETLSDLDFQHFTMTDNFIYLIVRKMGRNITTSVLFNNPICYHSI